MTRTLTRRSTAAAVALVAVLTACGGDDSAGTTVAPATTAAVTAAPTSTVAPEGDDLAVLTGEPFPDARCAANQAAGTVNYYTGFDYAATASIIEVLVAESAGYYDELCLDVEITPSFSTANYPIVAANEAQFASAGSFSEVAAYAEANAAALVALTVDGHTSIETLLVKPGVATELADLEGTTIGIKGALPSAVAAMLAGAGLIEGENFETLLLDGFDPVAHMAVPDIVGLPGWKSNEPGALERAGVAFNEFDPADHDVPGSFGLIYTNQAFIDAHPTAAEDFVRATLRGLNDALADPEAAAAAAFELVESGGNPNFLSLDGETFRWQTDAALITATTPADTFPGVPVEAEFAAQIAAYDAVGMYPDGAPEMDGRFSMLAATLYDEAGTIIWPT
jgi:ABC-type nitrate/sulfonate/bicarbonate transport system substrate-binding protein